MQKTLIKIIDNDINPYVDQWEKEGHYPAHEESQWRHLRNVLKIFASLYLRTQDPATLELVWKTSIFLPLQRLLHIEHQSWCAEIQDQSLSSILLL